MSIFSAKDNGKLDIIIDKKTFYPGNTIRGKLLLNLDAPIKARALIIQLCGTTHTNDSDMITYLATKTLSKSRVYKNGEQHEFEIKIPENAIPTKAGALETLRRIFSPKPDEFYLDASLDIPLKFDINEKQSIDIISTVASMQKTDLSYPRQQVK